MKCYTTPENSDTSIVAVLAFQIQTHLNLAYICANASFSECCSLLSISKVSYNGDVMKTPSRMKMCIALLTYGNGNWDPFENYDRIFTSCSHPLVCLKTILRLCLFTLHVLIFQSDLVFTEIQFFYVAVHIICPSCWNVNSVQRWGDTHGQRITHTASCLWVHIWMLHLCLSV